MPIEDLHYLYNNSVKESIIILIDSDKRDKLTWKEPSEFQINFDEPFKLVYGIDVLDISVPRTMYGIEDHNNILRFTVGNKVNVLDTSAYNELSVDSRDYSLQEFIAIMNESPLNTNNIKVATIIENIEENRNSVLTFSNTDNPPKPFVFDMKGSTIASNIGFNSLAQSKKEHLYAKVESESNEQLFASVPIGKEQFTLVVPQDTSITSSAFFTQISFYNDTDNVVKPINIQEQVLYSDISQVVNPDKKEVGFYISNISIEHSPDSNNTLYPNIRFSIYQLDLSSVLGLNETEAIIDIFKTQMTSGLSLDNMSNIESLVGMVDNSNVNMETMSILNRNDEIIYAMHHNAERNMYEWNTSANNEDYFNMIPINPVGNIVHFIYGVSFSPINVVHKIIETITYELTFIDSFKITSPGLVKLFGERYVVVHCDNIENHLRGSMVYDKYSPGLALVNLSTLGYTQSRNDFFGVKYKQFHPIGKLNNLKFRVNRPDGELYNFKNVNWHMLLSVKYYAVRNPNNEFGRYTLNPNYEPNFIEYQTKHDKLMNETEYDTSSDSGDEDQALNDEVHFRNRYLKTEQELERKFLNNRR
jgi:hypothetical protein